LQICATAVVIKIIVLLLLIIIIIAFLICSIQCGITFIVYL
jgi:hypothetical protein